MFRFVYPRYLSGSVSLVREIRAEHTVRTYNRSVVLPKASTTAKMSNDPNIKKYFDVARKLTLEAGELFKRGFRGEKIVEFKEIETDLVTDYDRKLEELLINGLLAEFPDHKFIAEESVAKTKEIPELTDDPTWLIDPIDGTLNFVHTFPQCCISVALSICREIQIGIIYNPMTSEMYTAMKGQGAFLNDERIYSTKTTELKKALMTLEVFALNLCTKNRDIRLGRFEALVAASQGARGIGSAALTMAYIASGSIDCFHLDALQPWDIAAGLLIVREAGGTVIDTRGGPYDFMKPNTIAASTDDLAQEISKLIIDTDLKTQRKRLQRK